MQYSGKAKKEGAERYGRRECTISHGCEFVLCPGCFEQLVLPISNVGRGIFIVIFHDNSLIQCPGLLQLFNGLECTHSFTYVGRFEDVRPCHQYVCTGGYRLPSCIQVDPAVYLDLGR